MLYLHIFRAPKARKRLLAWRDRCSESAEPPSTSQRSRGRGAVCDISVAPERGQWWRGSAVLDLNPQGRTQNRKHRALVPVVPLLNDWLAAELDDYEALPVEERLGRGFLVNYSGRGIRDVDSAWDAIFVALKMPTGREWRPYVLRHSLARLVRNRGAELWDAQGFMGHHPGGQTGSTRWATFRPS